MPSAATFAAAQPGRAGSDAARLRCPLLRRCGSHAAHPLWTAARGRKKRKEWAPDAEDYLPDGADFTEEEVRVMRERRKSVGSKKPKKQWYDGGEDDSWVPGDG